MKIYLRLLLTVIVSVCFVNIASAKELKKLSASAVEMNKDMAVLYFDSNRRLDLSIMAEFIQYCSEHADVVCICAESSDAKEADIMESFKGTGDEKYLYKGVSDKPLPRMEFLKDSELVGTIEKGGSFAILTDAYLSFLAGEIDKANLMTKIDEAESAEEFKKIVPRMRFVHMLAKKGQIDSAIKELDKMSAYNLDNKGKLMLGEAYLRFKAPEKAAAILSKCDDIDCTFYKGVAEYLAGNMDAALNTLQGLRGIYSDVNKLNYFLKKTYEAKGDMKHADEIRLPENYNINSD